MAIENAPTITVPFAGVITAPCPYMAYCQYARNPVVNAYRLLYVPILPVAVTLRMRPKGVRYGSSGEAQNNPYRLRVRNPPPMRPTYHANRYRHRSCAISTIAYVHGTRGDNASELIRSLSYRWQLEIFTTVASLPVPAVMADSTTGNRASKSFTLLVNEIPQPVVEMIVRVVGGLIAMATLYRIRGWNYPIRRYPTYHNPILPRDIAWNG